MRVKKCCLFFVFALTVVFLFFFYAHNRSVMTMRVAPENKANLDDEYFLAKQPPTLPDNKPLNDKKIDADVVAPFTDIDGVYGEISIDISDYRHIQIGSEVSLETTSGEYDITVQDVILNDDGSYSYNLLGEDGSNSLFIYFPDTGKSYVTLSTKDMYITSFLDQNGVGKYVNLTALVKNGFKYETNDYLNSYLKSKADKEDREGGASRALSH